MENHKKWNSLLLSSSYTRTTSSLDTVKLLIENGADINIKEKDGWTALMLACRNSNTESSLETVKLLLENGANVNLRDIK